MSVLVPKAAPTLPEATSRGLSPTAHEMPGIPKPEYPRPDRDRSQRWINLNGQWDFQGDHATPEPITVPFAWETPASGIGRTWLEHGRYERLIEAPAEWADARIVLCFGAVHHHAVVSLDGEPLGEHTGGYTPFEFDLTERLMPGTSARLTVDVDAPADKRTIPHGKQRSIPRDDYDGVSFTPTSGIWQTVWLEARGRTYPSTITVSGDSLDAIELTGRVAGDHINGVTVHARVIEGSHEREETTLVTDDQGSFEGRLTIAYPRLWSPADPHLYRIELTTGTDDHPDRVIITTGLCRIETADDQIRLNGERLYIRGVLDQGYWPDTGLTAPDDAALVRDLELARSLGYNLVRKHIKLEEPRWLHHADRAGILVWAEPPGPSRYTPEAAAAFEAQLAPMVERDGAHPAIIIWGLYNEEWGLDWDIPGSHERAAAAQRAYDTLRALDTSRPIVENSGWAHVRTDLVDWHYYDESPATWAANLNALAAGEREDFPVKLGPDFTVDKPLYGSPDHPRHGVPILNSEYGAGFTSLERAWHLRWQTQELRRHDRFVGYVYTELADVEHEMAGLVNIHRQPKDRGGLNPADINADTTIIIDLIPGAAGADIPVPTEPFELAVRVSHHGDEPLQGNVKAAWTHSGRPFPDTTPNPDAETTKLIVQPWRTSDPVSLTVPPPSKPARLLIWLTTSNGEIAARTYLDAAPIEPPNRRGARTA